MAVNASQLAQGCEAIIACHGYCIDTNGCTYSDIFTEDALIKTIFDWQNAVYLLVIFSAIVLSKVIFKKQYEFHIASSHDTFDARKSFAHAMTKRDLTVAASAGAAQAGNNS